MARVADLWLALLLQNQICPYAGMQSSVLFRREGLPARASDV